MSITDLDNEISKNSEKIASLVKQQDELNSENEKLKELRKIAVFELVFDNTRVDDVLTFSQNTPYLSGAKLAGFTVKIVRKNKKSLTILYISNDRPQYKWLDSMVGKTSRIQNLAFGELVFNYVENFKKMSQRNESLRKLFE
jgi:hypothetical protein